MVNNNLAFRFTEEMYATKYDVSKKLGTSLIDNIWNSILEYRNQFNQRLRIYSIDGNPFNYCACNYIQNLISSLEDKIVDISHDIDKLTPNNNSLLKKDSLFNILFSLTKLNNFAINEEQIKSIIKGDISASRDDELHLSRYLKALSFIENHIDSNLDRNYILTLASILKGNNVNYRFIEDNSFANKVLVDRVYTSAPTKLIDPFMNNLFYFVTNADYSPLLKAFISYFYISYIKPFDLFNEEIALLFAKAVLIKDINGNKTTILPLEMIWDESENTIQRLLTETQKYKDVTYFVSYQAMLLDGKLNDLNNLIINYTVNDIKEDFYKVDEDEIEEVKENNVQDIVKEVKVTPKIENPTLVKTEETPKIEEKEIVSPNKPTNTGRAFSFIPPEIDEKEALRLENYLLESCPELKKNEAKFYARHCTLGKRYTIQQFKKSIGCVYETARTSMEHLTELGYYRKEQIKNKFVYTPIEKN